MSYEQPASLDAASAVASRSLRTPRRQRDDTRKLTTIALAAALCALACVHARAQANAGSLAPDAASDAAAVTPDNDMTRPIRHRARTKPRNGDLYLDVSLDGQRTALIAHFHERDGKLYATPADLDALGLRLPPSQADATHNTDTTEIPLDALPGLHYRYDVVNQSIDIEAPDALHKAYVLDMRALGKVPPASASRGFVLNYDAYAEDANAARLAIWTEERFFAPGGVFSNTGTAYLYQDLHRYVRFDTWWRSSNTASLSTTQLGDTISSSLDWSRSMRIGGFQWRSNFALRPDLITFPVPTLSGSSVVPSSVELYVNNVRQYSGSVPSGPFVINNVPGITGGGEATVVTRDALGRAVATTVPLYIDTRLLAAGITAHSVEAGFLRRAYGVDSFNYDTRPVASASYRRGVSDQLTFEAHAEAASGLLDAGAGALFRLGTLGVFNGSLAASGGRFDGAQVGLGYQLIQPAFSVELDTLRATRHYGDLAARDGAPVPLSTDRATVSVPLPGNQTMALSYVGYRYPQIQPAHIASLSYTVNFRSLASVTMSTFRNFSANASSGVFLSASFALGNKTSINGSAGRTNDTTTYNVNASRVPDYDGGWGWTVQDGGSNAIRYQQAMAQYLGRYGQVTAQGQTMNGHVAASLDVSGAFVLMDGSVLPARRIDDGFALVSTDGVSGVPVLHENRLIGKTDSNGHLLVPDLNAYQSNLLGIDSMGLPAQARIASSSANVVPQSQSGVLANFHITQYRAASLILQGPDGKLLPAGTRVHQVESGTDTIVGYDGLTFVDNLQADNHLLVKAGRLHCAVEFPYVRPTDASLPTYGPLTCRPVSGDTP
ncbi:fimbria/pilus outer membrane usher protein [Paraburkholderia sp. C35]|uniref:fimbria/pilus outer membrane usher protein n=1 Tax=Paraburkholderia sp. C35 TaxID=2126993 RepID=UPI001EF706FD|nr:fimbria/pilus outer membrane usher protein [Paraburkholderia sp. C35]